MKCPICGINFNRPIRSTEDMEIYCRSCFEHLSMNNSFPSNQMEQKPVKTKKLIPRFKNRFEALEIR
jgi:hypothetical protein